MMTLPKDSAQAVKVLAGAIVHKNADYSRGKWRVVVPVRWFTHPVDGLPAHWFEYAPATSVELWVSAEFDHPDLGEMTIDGPVCGETKRDVVALLEALRVNAADEEYGDMCDTLAERARVALYAADDVTWIGRDTPQ